MKKILTLIKVDLLDSKVSLFVAILSAFLLGLMFVAFFPTIRDNAESYNSLLEGELAAIFTDAPDGVNQGLDLSDYNAYINIEYFSFFWAVLFVPFLVAWGTKLAGQAEKGTLALFLAQPVTRSQVILSQLVSLFIKSGLSATAMVLSVWLPAIFVEGVYINSRGWTSVLGLMILVFTAFSFFATASSLTFMSKLKGIWITSGIISVGYILNVFARLVESVDSIKFFSVFYYIGDLTHQLKGVKNLEITSVIFFTVIIIGSALVSWIAMKQKDLPNG